MSEEKMQTSPFECPAWFDGKKINETVFCKEFLRDYPMVTVNGAFFTVNGRVHDENRLKKVIYDRIKYYVTSGVAKKVSNLLDVMRMECCTAKLSLYQDRIHVANEIPLIALLSLFLQVHRQLRCDDCLDVVGLGQSFQLHIIVQHHKLMFQIGTSERACLHFCNTARVHVTAQQRTKNNTDTALALAALADQQEHLLSLGGWDKAISHELLQGQNILRL